MPRLVYPAIALRPGVLSQTTTAAICTVDSLSWTFNTLGDSPCQVTADLAGVCSGGVFNLERLDDGSVYPGLTIETQNPCRCSSVYYSVLSACAACQGRDWIDWDEYDGNCSTIYPGVFLPPILEGTRVPGWAYADVRVTGAFNLTIAGTLHLLPESTGTAPPTNSFTLPTTSSRTSFSRSTIYPTASSITTTSLGSASLAEAPVFLGVLAALAGVIGLTCYLTHHCPIPPRLRLFLIERWRIGPRPKQPPSSAIDSTTPDTAAPHNPDQNSSLNSRMEPSTPIQRNLNDLSNPSPVPRPPSPSPSYKSTSSSSPPWALPPYESTVLPPYPAQTYPPSQGLATQV